jgi:hypothetical protein
VIEDAPRNEATSRRGITPCRNGRPGDTACPSRLMAKRDTIAVVEEHHGAD